MWNFHSFQLANSIKDAWMLPTQLLMHWYCVRNMVDMEIQDTQVHCGLVAQQGTVTSSYDMDSGEFVLVFDSDGGIEFSKDC